MADPGREPVVGVVAREVEAGRAAVAAGRARPQRAQERPQPDVRDAVVCEPQHPQAPVGGEAAGQRRGAAVADAVVVQKQLDEVAGRERAPDPLDGGVPEAAPHERDGAQAADLAEDVVADARADRPSDVAVARGPRRARRQAPVVVRVVDAHRLEPQPGRADRAPERGEGLGAEPAARRGVSRSVRQPPSAAARSVSTGAATTTTVRSAQFHARRCSAKSAAAAPASGWPPSLAASGSAARLVRRAMASPRRPGATQTGRAAVVGRWPAPASAAAAAPRRAASTTRATVSIVRGGTASRRPASRRRRAAWRRRCARHRRFSANVAAAFARTQARRATFRPARPRQRACANRAQTPRAARRRRSLRATRR